MDVNQCPLCNSNSKVFFKKPDFKYHQCLTCELIFLTELGEANKLLIYDNIYWEAENKAALERSKGASLERFLELLVLSSIPIKTFLDVGTGGGQLLDELENIFCSSISLFGIELFPPASEYQTSHPGYIKGELKELDSKRYDAITSIEVLEHLNPVQAREMLTNLSRILNDEGIALINSGNNIYVEKEDPEYLDPVYRGHNFVYSMKAIEILIEGLPLQLVRRKNSNWSFFLKKSANSDVFSIDDQLWKTHPYNLKLMYDPYKNDILYMLGRESCRVYL